MAGILHRESPRVRRPETVAARTARHLGLRDSCGDDNALRRRHGRYYTPEWLAREIVDGCLGGAAGLGSLAPGSPPRILDPACGTGAFLLTAFDRLAGFRITFLPA